MIYKEFLVHATETLLYSIIEKELLSIALKYYIGQHDQTKFGFITQAFT